MSFKDLGGINKYSSYNNIKTNGIVAQSIYTKDLEITNDLFVENIEDGKNDIFTFGGVGNEEWKFVIDNDTSNNRSDMFFTSEQQNRTFTISNGDVKDTSNNIISFNGGNDGIKSYRNLNMLNNKITDLSNGIRPTDAVNLSQINKNFIATYFFKSRLDQYTQGFNDRQSFDNLSTLISNGFILNTTNTTKFLISQTTGASNAVFNFNYDPVIDEFEFREAPPTGNAQFATFNTTDTYYPKAYTMSVARPLINTGYTLNFTIFEDMTTPDSIISIRDGNIDVFNITKTNINSEIDMSNNKITDLSNGTHPTDAVNLSQINGKLDLTGGTMTGDLIIDRSGSVAIKTPLNITDTTGGLTPSLKYTYNNINATANYSLLSIDSARQYGEGAEIKLNNTDSSNFSIKSLYYNFSDYRTEIIHYSAAPNQTISLVFRDNIIEFFNQIDMCNNKITDLSNGTQPTDAVNLSQLDEKLNLTGGTISGDLEINNTNIIRTNQSYYINELEGTNFTRPGNNVIYDESVSWTPYSKSVSFINTVSVDIENFSSGSNSTFTINCIILFYNGVNIVRNIQRSIISPDNTFANITTTTVTFRDLFVSGSIQTNESLVTVSVLGRSANTLDFRVLRTLEHI